MASSADLQSLALTPSGDRILFDRGSVPSYVVLLAALAFLLGAVLLGPFQWSSATFGAVLILVVLMVGVGVAVRWLGSPAIGTFIEASALVFGVATAAPLCAVVAASSALPLTDQLLARADALLFFGFDRRLLMEQLAGQAMFFDLVRPIYHGLLPQPFLILFFLCVSARTRFAWTFALAWGLTLGLSLAIFPFFPAYGTPPYALDFIDTLTAARDGSLRVLDQSALTGIITFPSFHAAAAVVLGWAGSKIRLVGPLFVGFNVLMFGSALVGGGHYLIDLVAGALIGVAGIMAAQAIQRRVDP